MRIDEIAAEDHRMFSGARELALAYIMIKTHLGGGYQ